MIEYKMNISNLPSLKKYQRKIKNASEKTQIYGVMAASRLAGRLSNNTTNYLGDKSRYFNTKVVPMGFQSSVIYSSTHEKGLYIYYGTKPHSYRSSKPMGPLPDGGFTMRVNHPGAVGRKKPINAIARQAIAETRRELISEIRKGLLR